MSLSVMHRPAISGPGRLGDTERSCPDWEEQMSLETRNHILSTLAAPDAALLAPHLEPLELPRRFVLEAPNKPIGHVYFLDDGIASVVAAVPHGQEIEVGIIGRDGVTGHPVIAGTNRWANSTFIQVEGRGLRIGSDRLRDEMRGSRSLQAALLVFIQAFVIQASHTALANGRAKLDARLARWLLMAHDRVEGDQLPLTHEFLAVMLGVQRPGVTLALKKLEEEGLIETRRNNIVIEDRAGLVLLAQGFYGIPEAEQARLTGWRSLHQ